MYPPAESGLLTVQSSIFIGSIVGRRDTLIYTFISRCQGYSRVIQFLPVYIITRQVRGRRDIKHI